MDTVIEIKHLEKHFGDLRVLNDINFTIERGKVVTIIGSSGSGKSTLLRCINLLEVPDAGEILFNGQNILKGDLDASTYRSKVGMVFQQPNPFPMSIYDNIAYGPRTHGIHNKAKLNEIVETSLRQAAIWDEVKDRLNKSALGMSGGQQQRLCIARALLKKPKVLILDDSTSAVDTATDAKIRRAFREEIPDTTKLIIAQRISSVQDADRIIVMEDGKVNGFGTHEELLEQNDIYREVYESQTSGGGDFDEKEGK